MRTSRSSSQRFLYLGCAAALCSWSSALNAQEVELRSEAGFSLPTRISIQNRVLVVRQKIGMTVGARLTLTFSQRFNVVTRVTYVPGYAMLHGAGNRIDVGTSSHLLSGTTGARYWLLPPARKLSLEVHTGVGVVFGGQPAYVDLFESSTVSGVLGTTAHYKIGRIATLQVRVQDRLYRVRFGTQNRGSSRSPLQLSVGLGLPFQESAP
jgi:hypothetical protein